MSKDPAFLFYTNDFERGVQFFTDEQVGKYLRLLMAQHQHGHLTENQMIFICKSYDNDVFSKFVKDSNGLWYNERLESEILKRKNFTESRGKNKLGKRKTSKSYDNHMENEIENENESKKENKKRTAPKIQNLLIPEEVSATIPSSWNKAEFETLLLKWAAKRKKKPDTELAILRVSELIERRPNWIDAKKNMIEAAAEGWMKLVYTDKETATQPEGRYAHERKTIFDKA